MNILNAFKCMGAAKAGPIGVSRCRLRAAVHVNTNAYSSTKRKCQLTDNSQTAHREQSRWCRLIRVIWSS